MKRNGWLVISGRDVWIRRNRKGCGWVSERDRRVWDKGWRSVLMESNTHWGVNMPIIGNKGNDVWIALLIAFFPLLDSEEDLCGEHNGVFERVVEMENADEIGVTLMLWAAHKAHFEVERVILNLERIGWKTIKVWEEEKKKNKRILTNHIKRERERTKKRIRERERHIFRMKMRSS